MIVHTVYKFSVRRSDGGQIEKEDISFNDKLRRGRSTLFALTMTVLRPDGPSGLEHGMTAAPLSLNS